MTVAAVHAEYPKTVVLSDGTHIELRLAEARAERVCIVAVDGEHHAAELTLEPGAEAARASGDLRLEIAPGYRHRRLGTWMLLDAVHLATGLGCEELRAQVENEDVRYRAALERLDFWGGEAVGESRTFRKRLHHAWTDF